MFLWKVFTGPMVEVIHINTVPCCLVIFVFGHWENWLFSWYFSDLFGHRSPSPKVLSGQDPAVFLIFPVVLLQ